MQFWRCRGDELFDLGEQFRPCRQVPEQDHLGIGAGRSAKAQEIGELNLVALSEPMAHAALSHP